MSDHTPTTEQVKAFYEGNEPHPRRGQRSEAFDRWLAEEIRTAKEEAWDEGHYWGRQYHAQALNGDIPTSNPHREES